LEVTSHGEEIEAETLEEAKEMVDFGKNEK
jgi:hypothetical protein